jgi:hypothetical protein
MSANETLKQLLQNPPKRSKLYNHIQISMPNEMHQADLLFLPEDRRKKYALTLIDCASRYKASRPLANKTADEIITALSDIYKVDPYLDIPLVLNVDKGSEFDNNKMRTMCNKNGIQLLINLPSNHLAFVERFNSTLARLIFNRQHLKELENKRQNKQWVSTLQSDVDFLNNSVTRLIGMKPIDAIQLDSVTQPSNEFSMRELQMKRPIGAAVRRLLNKDEILNIVDHSITVERRRATDPHYSLVLYLVVDYVIRPNCLIMHKIQEVDGELYPHLYTYWQLLPI